MSSSLSGCRHEGSRPSVPSALPARPALAIRVSASASATGCPARRLSPIGACRTPGQVLSPADDVREQGAVSVHLATSAIIARQQKAAVHSPCRGQGLPSGRSIMRNPTGPTCHDPPGRSTSISGPCRACRGMHRSIRLASMLAMQSVNPAGHDRSAPAICHMYRDDPLPGLAIVIADAGMAGRGRAMPSSSQGGPCMG